MRTTSPTSASLRSSCACSSRRAAHDLVVLGVRLGRVDADRDRLVHGGRDDDAAALLAPALAVQRPRLAHVRLALLGPRLLLERLRRAAVRFGLRGLGGRRGFARRAAAASALCLGRGLGGLLGARRARGLRPRARPPRPRLGGLLGARRPPRRRPRLGGVAASSATGSAAFLARVRLAGLAGSSLTAAASASGASGASACSSAWVLSSAITHAPSRTPAGVAASAGARSAS